MTIPESASLKIGEPLIIRRDYAGYLNDYFANYPNKGIGMRVRFNGPYKGDKIYVLTDDGCRWWIYACMVDELNKRGHKLTKIFS